MEFNTRKRENIVPEILVLKNGSPVQLSCLVMSDSLQLHGLQHAWLPCPSTTPGGYKTHVHCIGDAIQPSHPLLANTTCTKKSQRFTKMLYLRGDIMGDLFLLPVSHLYFLTLVQLLSLSNEKHK